MTKTSTSKASSTTERTSAQVQIESVACGFDGNTVLKDLDLSINPGEFLTLLGPSGSGKTTLLRVIAGLIDPERGHVYVDGRDITKLPAQDRDLGFVFQNYALFPHMTVEQNLAYPLKIRKIAADKRRARVQEILELVELTGFGSRYPAQMSGGQQQRVALARALVHNPQVLLLDEPLGALDRRLRQQLGRELRRIQRETLTTAIYVTHDQEEAFVLSDRVGIMSDGVLAQLDSPLELYRHPANLFVASFLGDVNILQGVVSTTPGVVEVEGSALTCVRREDLSAGESIAVIVRPEHLILRPASGPLPENASYLTSAKIEDAYFLGQSYRVQLSWSQKDITADIDTEGYLPSVGEMVKVGVHQGVASLVRS
ncbi:MAG: ABC transporter ATP-binding protein [Propionibacteriaceae bacterium]|jgi:ABC-type Fe3+/spermidine/putrescine transport system ATPase subunit|nr:ABC transporter ATP-binding protein [Propionibacteriaceae bacterium]